MIQVSRVYDYLDKLEKDKQLFVDILNSKDITSSSNETFSTLVPKINSMVDINGYYDLTKKSSGGIPQYIKQIPMIDTSGYTLMNDMFRNFTLLTSIPLLDTSKVTSMTQMFYGCSKLTSIPQLDTSKVRNMDYMFRECHSLTAIPQLDTSSVTTFSRAFYQCEALTSIPQLDTSNVTNMYDMFTYCSSLTILGGFINLGQAYDTSKSSNYQNYTLSLSWCSNLTHDSLMNVINNLYDIATKGCQPQRLQLGSTNLAKLTEEEIAIATNKGWTVS